MKGLNDMITFLNLKHISSTQDGKEEVLAVISVSSSSELPNGCIYGNKVMVQGSLAWDIVTGDWYGAVNSTWVKQPAPPNFEFCEGV